MAQHIDSVVASLIPKVSPGEFLYRAQSGDLVFCSGADGISVPIEKETKSPFSHVFRLWKPAGVSVFLVQQSTIQRGVGVDPISQYVDYNGDLVLCRREVLTDADNEAITNRFLSILDDKYDWVTEVGIAAHKLLACMPVLDPKNEYYCSGAQTYASQAANPALRWLDKKYMPTPEENFTDPTVVPLCALLKGGTK
jgi:hypothetical protein